MDARASYSAAEQRERPTKYTPDTAARGAPGARSGRTKLQRTTPTPRRRRTWPMHREAPGPAGRGRGRDGKGDGEQGRCHERGQEDPGASSWPALAPSLATFKGDLNKTQDVADRRSRQAPGAAADARAKDAIDKLALASVPMKQEDRGTVITLPGRRAVRVQQIGACSRLAQDSSQPGRGRFLKDQQDHKITVEGYTDSRGSDESNQLLSQQRADSVRNFLVSRGVAGDQIDARGLGPNRPVASNKTRRRAGRQPPGGDRREA